MEVFKSEPTVAKPDDTWLNCSANCCALCTTACRSEILLGSVERVCNELKKPDKSAVKPFGLETELAALVEPLSCSSKYASTCCIAPCWDVSEPVTLPSAVICEFKSESHSWVIDTASTPVPSCPIVVCSGIAAWTCSVWSA